MMFSMDFPEVETTFQENTRVKKTNEHDLYTKQDIHRGNKGAIIISITMNLIRKIIQILICKVMRKYKRVEFTLYILLISNSYAQGNWIKCR
jgi:hypothetical protein